MVIPLRRYRHEDLSGSNVDASGIWLKYRAIRLPRPVRLLVPLTFGGYGASTAANLLLPRFLGHGNSFRSGQPAKPRKEGTLLNEISPDGAPNRNHCFVHGTWDHAFDRV
jgi:hypothetical protein